MNHSTTRSLAFALLVIGMLAAGASRANNIAVTSPTLTGNTGTTAFIQFNLSWANSWRGGAVTNWDAAWVFVKFRNSISGDWAHAKLDNTGHTAPAGSQIAPGLLSPSSAFDPVSNPVMGAFIHRSATGTGTFTLTGVQLRWDFAAQGLNYNDIGQVEVFAIEMAYVPQGSYTAGTLGSEANAFFAIQITTADASAPNGHPYAWDLLAPTWPNGFNAFYSMKYELSQQGYVDFLNTLTYAQQIERTANAPNSAAGTGALVTGNTNRNGIDVQSPGVPSTTPAIYACNLDGDGVYGEATDGKDIACNFLSVFDLCAYLFWSGLRPMTELEFEKACRGGLPAVTNEYPWGTTSIASSANLPGTSYTLANAGANNESIATNYGTSAGNAAYVFTAAFIDGPLRVGVFAANAGNTGRVSAGATHYGIMEMGGNVWERPLNYDSFQYTGFHGNGSAFVPTSWVDFVGVGIGLRGGTYGSPATQLRVADRTNASIENISRNSNFGGRGVRTAP